MVDATPTPREPSRPLEVLFVSNRPAWPPFPGYKARAGLVLEALCRDHRVTAAIAVSDPQADPLVDPTLPLVALHHEPAPRRSAPTALLQWVVSRLPWPTLKIDWAATRPMVDGLLARHRYDLVVAIDTSAWTMLPESLPVPLVIDFDDLNDRKIEHRRKARRPWRSLSNGERFFSVLDRFDEGRWRRLQQRVLDRAGAVTICSEQDRVLLGRPNVAVLPNGYREPATAGRWQATERSQPAVVMIGALGYRPNVEAAEYFARDVMPTLRGLRPDVRFRLVGGGEDAVSGLGSLPGVEVVGRVDTVEGELLGAALVVVPLLSGGGTRIKILEAWAYGVPVVSTTVGAEGLDVHDGLDIVLADTPAELAAACASLMADPARASAIAAGGNATYRRLYTPDAVARAVRGAVALALAGTDRSVSA